MGEIIKCIVQWVNDVFGITNTTSATLLITLFVFVSGGIVKYIQGYIKRRISKGNIRNSYINILNEIIYKARLNANNTKKFYTSLNINVEGKIVFHTVKFPFIESLIKTDNHIYFVAFTSKYFKKKEKVIESFNNSWTTLETLCSVEDKIKNDFISLSTQRENLEIEFYSLFNQLIVEWNTMLQRIEGDDNHIVLLSRSQGNYYDELKTIFNNYNKADDKIATNIAYIYESLLLPLFNAHNNNLKGADNKYFSLVLSIINKHTRLKKLYNLYYNIFKGHSDLYEEVISNLSEFYRVLSGKEPS